MLSARVVVGHHDAPAAEAHVGPRAASAAAIRSAPGKSW